MKIALLSLIVILCIIPNMAQNNVDALTPEDVEAFRTLHADDTAVLFFHNSDESKKTGFFESIFGLFGSKEDLDEDFQAMIAEKYPIIEIDTKIPELENVPDDYEVQTMPYVIAYHKNREIWREVPSKQTANIIENLIEDDNRGIEFNFENKAPVEIPKVVKKDIDLNTLRKAPSSVEVVDPFDSSKHYKVDQREYYDQDFGHMYSSRYGMPAGAIINEPVVQTTLGPVSTNVPHVYPGESNRVIQRPRTVIRDNLEGVQTRVVSSNSTAMPQRNYVRSVPSGERRVVTSNSTVVPQYNYARSAPAGERRVVTTQGAPRTTTQTTTTTSSGSRSTTTQNGSQRVVSQGSAPRVAVQNAPVEVLEGIIVRTYDADNN